MATQAATSDQSVPGISWLGYAIVTGLTASSSIYIIFFDPSRDLRLINSGVFGLGLGALGAIIAVTAFKSGERWAWFALWIPVIAYTIVAVNEIAANVPDAGYFFLAVAVLDALALLISAGRVLSQ